MFWCIAPDRLYIAEGINDLLNHAGIQRTHARCSNSSGKTVNWGSYRRITDAIGETAKQRFMALLNRLAAEARALNDARMNLVHEIAKRDDHSLGEVLLVGSVSSTAPPARHGSKAESETSRDGQKGQHRDDDK
jgi:hypothetical protein